MFSKKPMAISLDTYDAVKFILQARNQEKINPHSVIQYLNSSKANYKGISSLTVKAGLKLNVSDRFLMKIDETGYKVVK